MNPARPQTGGNSGTRGMFVASTEARPGFMTSELWLTLLSAITVVIAGYVSDAFPVDLGWILFASLIGAYTLSRGLAKAGSREGPFAGHITGGDRSS